MLPLTRQPQRPQALAPASVLAKVKYLVSGRQTIRWVMLGLGVVSILWLLLPRSYIPYRGWLHCGPPSLVKPVNRPACIRPPSSSERPSYSISNLTSPRAEAVRDAFLHAYNGYSQYAGTYDELLPVSGDKVNNFNGWAVTLIDALDTLWIMGLHDQFYDAIPQIARISFPTQRKLAPFFETVIRVLGGLLSAYALSGDSMLLARADDLGKALLPVFQTPSGLPMYSVDPATGETKSGWMGSQVIWAESMSCQLEYKYLAHLTGRVEYYHRVEHIMDMMYHWKVSQGLYPTIWKIENGIPANDKYSVGAFADSAYEYLLKQYLLTSQSEPKGAEMYTKAAKGIIDNLLYLSPTRNLLYVTDTNRGLPSRKLEHLSCFLPGLLALGTKTLALSAADRELHTWAAQGLVYTCYITYADSATGLGPDEMIMDAWPPSNGDPRSAGRWIERVQAWIKDGRPGGVPPGLHEPPPTHKAGSRDYYIKSSGYMLRPEAVESFYLLWRTTGDERWRDRGWEVFQAIDRHTRTKYGYASIRDVDSVPSVKKDEMPSYFLAETLKYLYLLFIDEELVPLDRWVFNTEAHPLPVFEWYEWEKIEYRIPRDSSVSPTLGR